MADSVKKRSNWVGKDRTDMVKYIVDIDKDIKNLFEEKTINIIHNKRYSYIVGSSYSA